MTSPRTHPTPKHWLERGLFASRWLMAPFYVGLVLALATLLIVFGQDLVHDIPAAIEAPRSDHAIVMALSLIDLSLAANLVVMVILSGYENFVAKIEAVDDDRPEWLGTLDFSGMKMKLIASIIAISAVALLRVFMALTEEDAHPDPVKLGWLVGLHVTFLASGVMMALMDRLSHKDAH